MLYFDLSSKIYYRFLWFTFLRCRLNNNIIWFTLLRCWLKTCLLRILILCLIWGNCNLIWNSDCVWVFLVSSKFTKKMGTYLILNSLGLIFKVWLINGFSFVYWLHLNNWWFHYLQLDWLYWWSLNFNKFGCLSNKIVTFR